MAKAIAMITKIDFTLAECATSTQAKFIARKMGNFMSVRTENEFNRKLAFYGLYEVANNLNQFAEVHGKFMSFGSTCEGVEVSLAA